MTLIWRFFAGEDGRWRWQTLTPGRVVVSESPSSYAHYDACLSAAARSGYRYQDAQKNSPWHGATRRSINGAAAAR